MNGGENGNLRKDNLHGSICVRCKKEALRLPHEVVLQIRRRFCSTSEVFQRWETCVTPKMPLWLVVK